LQSYGVILTYYSEIVQHYCQSALFLYICYFETKFYSIFRNWSQGTLKGEVSLYVYLLFD